MKVVQATRFGDPSVLLVAELPDPLPGPGEIAIDVACAAVGLLDVFFRRGLFKDAPGMPQPPFIPGLEVAGTVRAIGPDVEGFTLGESVVSMSATGTGGYASVYIAKASLVISTEGHDITPAQAVAVIPNAAMAHVALTEIAHLQKSESVLVHGALGGFSATFPGTARQLGASRVVGSVRRTKLDAALRTRLPYDRIVDSAALSEALGAEKFDVIVDPVGGELRSQSLSWLKPGGRLVVVGNASGDWANQMKTNDLWLGNVTVSGFNAGAYFPSHPQVIRPALEAALNAVARGLVETEVEILPLGDAAIAHERMEARSLSGRIVLATSPSGMLR